ncbi:helix-turn-helix domain-containing protein [Duganella sp. BuS-21]|uniref:helix-turn-helix domain-containing protein n=1 Tax=Duganella sp. BuS-21 TaxID=2943848 RepID=UPI0035A72F70
MRLRELRAAQDISQIKLAELTGFLRQYVSQAESGKVNLSVDTLERFFQHLLPADVTSVPIRLRLSGNVRSARASLGWSQEHLAGMAGVSLGYVGSLERGQVNASLSKIEALAGALKVEAQWLLEG